MKGRSSFDVNPRVVLAFGGIAKSPSGLYSRWLNEPITFGRRLLMNTLRILICLSFLFSTLGFASGAGRKEMAFNDWVGSPNGELSAAYSGRSIRIRDNVTGRVYPEVPVLTPLLSLKWTRDSKTIVTIEHIAGGSCAALVHFDGKTWRRYDADPSGGPYDHIEVLSQEIGQDRARITFAANVRRPGTIFAHFICAFDINAETNARSNETRKEVTETEFEALFSRLAKETGDKRP